MLRFVELLLLDPEACRIVDPSHLRASASSVQSPGIRSLTAPSLEHNTSSAMVCAKCQKLSKSTTLATPGVKKKSEMYYGSAASSSKSGEQSKTSATLGSNGIGKASNVTFTSGRD